MFKNVLIAVISSQTHNPFHRDAILKFINITAMLLLMALSRFGKSAKLYLVALGAKDTPRMRALKIWVLF